MDKIVEFSINNEICKRCQLCIKVCPSNIIDKDTNGETYFIPERKSICVRCGQCMAVCSTKAIIANGLSYNDDFTDLPDHHVDYENYIDFLANRRSIRNYKDKKVPDDIINKILDSVSFAPFGSAPEKVNITVVNDRSTIESSLPHIADFLDKIVKWIENPITSFIIRRKNSSETFSTIVNHLYPIAKLKNYQLKYGDRITRNAPALIIFHAEKNAAEHTDNSLIYATYVILAAHSLGLGASMISIVPAAINKVKEVRDIYHIPENHEATISVILGYPKLKYLRTIKRKVQKVNWI